MTLQWNTDAPAGSQWQRQFTLTNADGSLIDLTGLAWEFVVRPSVTDITSPALISVTTTPGAQGSITVDLPTSTLTVTLTPAATAVLKKGFYPLALWSAPTDASTRTAWVTGMFNSFPAALP
ncbi:hypothetical protein [Actinacidiphila acididurans]|uniref:Uncharacterized protein n=1 Tax=Actinacidiphila acididurans TaxID=2784346 RepID=A0ABS2U320_9ACTN|nr:hypothetical protein [Actinacidiphila acididurans]MBM9509979.1 hypothetical protein [Actinacidiphila acididurans]